MVTFWTVVKTSFLSSSGEATFWKNLVLLFISTSGHTVQKKHYSPYFLWKMNIRFITFTQMFLYCIFVVIQKTFLSLS